MLTQKKKKKKKYRPAVPFHLVPRHIKLTGFWLIQWAEGGKDFISATYYGLLGGTAEKIADKNGMQVTEGTEVPAVLAANQTWAFCTLGLWKEVGW